MLFLIVFLMLSVSFDSLHASGRSLKNAFESNLKTDLVKSFARLMTMKGEQCVIPEKNHHRAFMNQHWLNQWRFFKPYSRREQPAQPFVEFHRILSEKMEKHGVKHENIEIPSKGGSLRYYKTADIGFIDGHLVEFSDLEFKFPVVLVNLYPDAVYKNIAGEEIGGYQLSKYSGVGACVTIGIPRLY